VISNWRRAGCRAIKFTQTFSGERLARANHKSKFISAEGQSRDVFTDVGLRVGPEGPRQSNDMDFICMFPVL
jgi:hypothetical protein